MNRNNYDGYQDWKGWTQDEFGLYTQENSVYYLKELNLCGFDSLNKVNILEIGFGNGSFAAWSSAKGAKYIGIEAISNLVGEGRKKGYSTFTNKESISEIMKGQNADLVVAFDVMEHLEVIEFKNILAEIYQVLKINGTLFIRIPSGDSPFSRAIQYGDLTHKLTLGSLALRQICEEIGYKVVSIRSPAIPIKGLKLNQTIKRIFILISRALIYPFIKMILMDGEKVILSPNMVCILKK